MIFLRLEPDPCRICAGTGLAPRDICTGTGLTPATSAPGLRPPLTASALRTSRTSSLLLLRYMRGLCFLSRSIARASHAPRTRDYLLAFCCRRRAPPRRRQPARTPSTRRRPHSARARLLRPVSIAAAKGNFTVLNAYQPWRPRPVALLLSQLLPARCGQGHAAIRPNNGALA
jgi:hypothetical protein